jgi:hypothetical protein
MKYCQGPKCHEYKTKDRIRGPKGDKHYQTRRRTYLNYGDNFCSLNCQDDWFREYGTRAIDHFGRTTEAKRTDCDNAWYKDMVYLSYRDLPNEYYFKNDLLGQRIPITKEQYDNTDLVRP